MRFPTLLSTVGAALCLVLSVWLYTVSKTDQGLQADLQKSQTNLQTEQGQFQVKQQILQAKQQQLNAAQTLSQQVGPAVISDLQSLAVQNKNDKIKNLLSKYGIKAEEAPASTPAGSKPAAATPKP